MQGDEVQNRPLKWRKRSVSAPMNWRFRLPARSPPSR